MIGGFTCVTAGSAGSQRSGGDVPHQCTYGFIAARHKQGADVMWGCSIAQIEWVVFCESVRFLGQLSHSLKGSGVFFFVPRRSTNTKCSSFAALG